MPNSEDWAVVANLQSVKTTMSAKHDKVKCNKTNDAFILICMHLKSFLDPYRIYYQQNTSEQLTHFPNSSPLAQINPVLL